MSNEGKRCHSVSHPSVPMCAREPRDVLRPDLLPTSGLRSFFPEITLPVPDHRPGQIVPANSRREQINQDNVIVVEAAKSLVATLSASIDDVVSRYSSGGCVSRVIIDWLITSTSTN
ncbi:hypothetical protein EI94DRAFT_1725969, partial [Lactarius quietus]